MLQAKVLELQGCSISNKEVMVLIITSSWFVWFNPLFDRCSLRFSTLGTVWYTTVVLEKTLESPLGCKDFKPVNPKGNQPWIFIGRIAAEVPILWSPKAKSRLEKTLILGKIQQKENGQAEDEVVRYNHQLNGRQGRTEEPGVLQFMRSQRLGHDLATE